MHKRLSAGFTVVEVVIVIIVIALLATVTIVGYGAVTDKSDESTMKWDLQNAVTEIDIYRMDNNKLPGSAYDLRGGSGFALSGDNEINYVRVGDGYCAAVSSPNLPGVLFRVTMEHSSPKEGGC